MAVARNFSDDSAVAYVIQLYTSGFLDNVMFAHDRRRKGDPITGSILKVTHREQNPEAKSDVYDCLVLDGGR